LRFINDADKPKKIKTYIWCKVIVRAKGAEGIKVKSEEAKLAAGYAASDETGRLNRKLYIPLFLLEKN